jgi:molecular chaperone GrpE (heat shock protein)
VEAAKPELDSADTEDRISDAAPGPGDGGPTDVTAFPAASAEATAPSPAQPWDDLAGSTVTVDAGEPASSSTPVSSAEATADKPATDPPAAADEPVRGQLLRLDDELTALRAEVSGLRVLTKALRTDFAEKIRYDEVKERQLTELHREVQEHRKGLHQRLLRPVIDDLIRMHDDLAEAIDAGIAARPAAVEQTLASFLDSILETLSRCGVERREPEIGAEPDDLGAVVDRARQKVVRSVPTDNPELDRRVARRRRIGFDYDGRVLRAEWVEAYRYTPPANPAGEPDADVPATAANDAAPDHANA